MVQWWVMGCGFCLVVVVCVFFWVWQWRGFCGQSMCAFFFFFWWFLLVGLVVFFNGFASWHGGCGGGCWPVSGGINGM